MTPDRELARPADVERIMRHPGADDVVQYSRYLFAPWDYGPAGQYEPRGDAEHHANGVRRRRGHDPRF
jgi:transposase